MRKFLSALNLICVMFIFGCSKNSNDFKKYDFSFSEISNSYLTVINGGPTMFINIDDVKSQLPSNVVPDIHVWTEFDSHSFRYDGYSTRQEVQNFYKSNAKKVSGNFGNTPYDRYIIDKLVDVKITFSNKNYRQEWGVISFSAEMPH
ncbi:hypothetical protein [Spiroplasma endosymbiont of Dilophus febrilis]|uniref:hypothetical protein n=1 Tax=Spiroplasma endosymbiont of Dilophus febrilis TaxID=3066292 RepID=UPI00313BB254